jgi:L-asparagine transporter-like permease
MQSTEWIMAEEDLHRGLKERHVQMIAIGGTIGVGLFLGSATAIQKAGPGLVMSYAIGGLAMFFIMRALGELLLYRPVSGSFASYAEEFVGPWAGFMTGWSYWFMWVAIGMAEITAVGVYVHDWFPGIPQWFPALITLGLLFTANLITVKLFGEIEFWFALVKVAAIAVVMVVGLTIIVFKFGDLGKTGSFSNLWTQGGFFPFGALGVFLPLQMVMFAYQGLELVGVSAGETENPKKVLPRAINSVVYWMLVLYIGALLIIMSLVPWNQLSLETSPFVLIFEKSGIPAAAGIINFVVITAASIVVQQRALQHRAHAPQLGPGWTGSAGIWQGQQAERSGSRHHSVGDDYVDRCGPELFRSGEGFHLCDQHIFGGSAVDLGIDRHCPSGIPQGGCGRHGTSGRLPDAWVAIHELVCGGISHSRRTTPQPE